MGELKITIKYCCAARNREHAPQFEKAPIFVLCRMVSCHMLKFEFHSADFHRNFRAEKVVDTDYESRADINGDKS